MKKTWWTVIAVLVLGGLVVGLLYTTRGQKQTVNIPDPNASQAEKDSAAVKAGKELSNNRCRGSGPRELTRLPMEQTDYSMILPYGLMVGGHVTPIDHQYFSPTVFNSPRDTYPVYAMADSKIVDIQPRTNDRGTEYRFVFTMSCTFLYYYDLVTSLAPEIKTYYDKRDFNIDVKAGQLVGRIGGQTLDFAVWDTTKPLQNFVNPTSYVGESWKIYTADPLDYYSTDAKAKALSKYVRTAIPLSGRIDYDIDGKLRGNWFVKGSGGYSAPSKDRSSYWSGHLAIAPEYLDNAATIVSFGSWNDGEAKQFVAKNPVDPTTVGTTSGVVKYELYGMNHYKSDGRLWDSMNLTLDPKLRVNENEFGGCVLFQLAEARVLKMEQFPNEKCAGVMTFSGKEQTYER
ncbi:MAG: hypothetical protein NUV80_05465 [Candidatus Berkelbacteria bacterium]|nr:hypothetical protein [Candidatus Berkelbacteria bacterium]MCR4307984.1 hypothetical protein [Candidatus Berkelbacteria bacterium]